MGNLMIHAAAGSAHKRGWLDLRAGLALFRSRDVSAGLKLGALLVGIGFTGLLVALEIPLEGVVSVLLPFLGWAIDAAVDGAEFVLAPLLVGAAVLPHLVARRNQPRT
jgi:hypothetical protein